MLIGVVKALNQSVSKRGGYSLRQLAFIKVESTLYHCVLYVVYYLLLYEPSLMTQIAAHESPELLIVLVVFLTSADEFRLCPSYLITIILL